MDQLRQPVLRAGGEAKALRVLALCYVLLLGAGLGLGSAHLAVKGRPLLGMTQIGPWMVWPRSGNRDIDPYMRAYLARGVHLPLGTGEGVELIAERDSERRPLDGTCRYRLAGATPTTRGWTLGVTDRNGVPFHLPLDRTGFSDAEVVREESGGLLITAASTPQEGNWLPLPASGRFQFRLRLYDTPISTQAGETRPANLLNIERVDCR